MDIIFHVVQCTYIYDQEAKQVVKVKYMLKKVENKEHKYHPDTKFAKATISNLEEVASILGPREITFHSQDDKYRMALGIPAATKQAPLLMHTDYKVTLPDHDFIVALPHKLTPSVIAAVRYRKIH